MVAIRSRWTRKRLAVLAVFVGVAAYVFVAIWMQPVALGSNATFTGIPGHNPTKEAGVGGPGPTQKKMGWPHVHRGGGPIADRPSHTGPRPPQPHSRRSSP